LLIGASVEPLLCGGRPITNSPRILLALLAYALVLRGFRLLGEESNYGYPEYEEEQLDDQ
jgi:hypothetical protein